MVADNKDDFSFQKLMAEFQQLKNIYTKWQKIVEKCDGKEPAQFIEEKIKEANDWRKRMEKIQTSLGNALDASEHEKAELHQLVGKLEEWAKKAKERLEALTSPPLKYASVWSVNKDKEKTVDIILHSGEQMNVKIDPELENKREKLNRGQKVRINDGFNIVQIPEGTLYENLGEDARIAAFLDQGRVEIFVKETDEKKTVVLAQPMIELHKQGLLKAGDRVRLDRQKVFVVEKMGSAETQDLYLTEFPDVSYDDIGGLDAAIGKIRESLENPYIYPERYERYQRKVIKGLCLYGPPGHGKTMLGKAIARELLERAMARLGMDIKEAVANFILINGPELSRWLVGQTEYLIREMFKAARQKAKQYPGIPVIMFIDECEGFLAQRGSRVSSDANKDYVNQFSTELDGVESRDNIIVIIGTNRIDLVDAAILRPGRIDLKLRIEIEGHEGAKKVFEKYLLPDLPFHAKYLDKEAYPALCADPKRISDYLISKAVERIFSPAEKARNKFLEVRFERGSARVFYFKDFLSGAIIQNIVNRVKDMVINREIAGGKDDGIKLKDIYESIEQEFLENEGLPNTLHAVSEWLKTRGIQENIAGVKPLIKRNGESKSADAGEENDLIMA